MTNLINISILNFNLSHSWQIDITHFYWTENKQVNSRILNDKLRSFRFPDLLIYKVWVINSKLLKAMSFLYCTLSCTSLICISWNILKSYFWFVNCCYLFFIYELASHCLIMQLAYVIHICLILDSNEIIMIRRLWGVFVALHVIITVSEHQTGGSQMKGMSFSSPPHPWLLL